MTYKEKLMQTLENCANEIAEIPALKDQTPLHILLCIAHTDGHVHIIFPHDIIRDDMIKVINEQAQLHSCIK